MDNLISWEQLKRNEPLLKKHIFTEIQLKVLKKKLQNKILNSNDKTYYYKFIRPKLRALLAFSGIEEFNVRGKEWMLPKRVLKAKRILQQIQNKHRRAKILISGSFLFNSKYRDIDVFIFTKYHKEDYRRKGVHVNFLPEEALNSLFFASLSRISISNFSTETKHEFKISLKEILQEYELLVQEILDKEKYQKEIRYFLIKMEYLAKGLILNPKELAELNNKFIRKNILLLLQKYLAENLALIYSKKELKILKQYLKDYQTLSKEYKQSQNLQYYMQTYQEALELAS